MAEDRSQFLADPIRALPPKVFISYSHQDRDFAERLAGDLSGHGIIVWWDEWGIRVGDSLLSKLQQGIIASSYLAIVLSPESVASSWVQEELNLALHRQLQERRVFVLPILFRECEVPPFLAEKKYADFSDDYDAGLQELLSAIQPIHPDSHGRSDDARYHHDWVFEYGMLGGLRAARAEITTHSRDLPYSVSCEITLVSNDTLSERFNAFEQAGYDWAWPLMLLAVLEDIADKAQTVVLIEGNRPATYEYRSSDPDRGVHVDVAVTARRLGPDPGEHVLYEWASVFSDIAARQREAIRETVSPSDRGACDQWVRSHPMQ